MLGYDPIRDAILRCGGQIATARGHNTMKIGPYYVYANTIPDECLYNLMKMDADWMWENVGNAKIDDLAKIVSESVDPRKKKKPSGLMVQKSLFSFGEEPPEQPEEEQMLFRAPPNRPRRRTTRETKTEKKSVVVPLHAYFGEEVVEPPEGTKTLRQFFGDEAIPLFKPRETVKEEPQEPQAEPPEEEQRIITIKKIPSFNSIKNIGEKPETLSDWQLLKRIGKLLAYQNAERYGLLPDEYFSGVASSGASGRTPKDLWLSKNADFYLEEYTKEFKKRGLDRIYTFFVEIIPEEERPEEEKIGYMIVDLTKRNPEWKQFMIDSYNDSTPQQKSLIKKWHKEGYELFDWLTVDGRSREYMKAEARNRGYEPDNLHQINISNYTLWFAKKKEEPVKKKPQEPIKEEPEEEPQTTYDIIPKGLIPVELGTRAYEGLSFDPEKRGKSISEGFDKELEDIYNDLLRYAETDAQKRYLDDWIVDFANRYAEKYKTYLSSMIGTYSAMIAGPSNFPAHRMEKRNERTDRLRHELLEWLDKQIKRAKKGFKEVAIEEEGGEIAHTENQIKMLEEKLEQAKEVNKIIRKKSYSDREKIERIMELGFSEKEASQLLKPNVMGNIGYAGYELTSIRNAIKSRKEKLERLKAREHKKEEKGWETLFTFGEGKGQIIADYEVDRLQIHFEGIPDDEIRTALKREGWRWSRTNKAWQRKLTKNALWSAKNILGRFYDDLTEVKEEPQEKVEETQKKTYAYKVGDIEFGTYAPGDWSDLEKNKNEQPPQFKVGDYVRYEYEPIRNHKSVITGQIEDILSSGPGHRYIIRTEDGETIRAYDYKGELTKIEGADMSDWADKKKELIETIKEDIGKKEEQSQPKRVDFSGGYAIEKPDENRIHIYFSEFPDRDVREYLKSNRWWWYRKAKAWTRYISDAAWDSVYGMIDRFYGGGPENAPEPEPTIEPEPQKPQQSKTAVVIPEQHGPVWRLRYLFPPEEGVEYVGSWITTPFTREPSHHQPQEFNTLKEALRYAETFGFKIGSYQEPRPYEPTYNKIIPFDFSRIKNYPLRPDQEEAVEKSMETHRGLIEAPTGAGKTIIFMELLKRKNPHKVVVLFPKIALLKQMEDRFVNEHDIPRTIIGHYYGQEKDLNKPIILTTYASAKQHPELIMGDADMVIFDEVHHALGDVALRSIIGYLANTNKEVFGFTATMTGDPEAVERLTYFLPPIYKSSFTEMRELGNISKAKLYMVPIDLDPETQAKYDKINEKIKNIRKALAKLGQYPQGTKDLQRLAKSPNEQIRNLALGLLRSYQDRIQILADAPSKHSAIPILIQDIQKEYDGPIMLFMDRVKNLESECNLLNSLGVGCKSITGQTKNRDYILNSWKRGDFPVLGSINVLAEGIDVPKAKVGIFVGNPGGEIKITQKAGRLLRKTETGEPARLYMVYLEGTPEINYVEKMADVLDVEVDRYDL